jgi:hypothetical protein
MDDIHPDKQLTWIRKASPDNAGHSWRATKKRNPDWMIFTPDEMKM